MTIGRIISGGQTGADRGGLDAAIELGIEHGGFCNRGRKAEDGRIPSKYLLTEIPSSNYKVRTLRNLLHAHGTLLFIEGDLSAESGSRLTFIECRKNNKPCRLINFSVETYDSALMAVREFLGMVAWEDIDPVILNVAGNRESISPGMQDRVRALLIDALKREGHERKESTRGIGLRARRF